MADENQDRDQRTEEATPQRILKARGDGQVGYSTEFVGGVVLMTGVLFFWGFGTSFFGSITSALSYRISDFETVVVDPRMLVGALVSDTQKFAMACVALLVPLVFLAGLCGLLQTNFNFSTKPLQLDWNKLSVKSGFGRIFSSKSAVRGGFAFLKAAIIICIAYYIARSRLDHIAVSGFGTFRDMMFSLGDILLLAAIAFAAMMLTVGLVDFGFQKWKHLQDLKMSIRDIKDENKASEGDPQIRARVKKLQAEMGRKRMLSGVPEASVVITNPTHFAVAIKYDRETMEAPVVIAKGADFLAKKIIEIAKENEVMVVERKPVARFLYFNASVGSPIPFELYQAVAEVLNFVQRVRASA